MLTFLALAVGLIVWLAPESGLGKPLRRVLVEWPAERLSRLRPGLVIVLLVIAAASVALIVFARDESAFLVAQGLPEAIASIFAFDVATYLDLLVVAWLLAASVRLRAVKAVLGSAVRRLRLALARRTAPRARTRRSRPAARPPAQADNDGWPGWALAA